MAVNIGLLFGVSVNSQLVRLQVWMKFGDSANSLGLSKKIYGKIVVCTHSTNPPAVLRGYVFWCSGVFQYNGKHDLCENNITQEVNDLRRG